MMHTIERFFHNGPDLEATDRIAAGILRTIITNTPVALAEPDKAADLTIEAVEKTFKSFGMPVNLRELGIEATDRDCRMLAEKASLKGKKTLGSFRILETEDMYRIYKAAK